MAHKYANINTAANDVRGAALVGSTPAIADDPTEALEGAFPGTASTLDMPVSAGVVDGVEIDAQTVTFTVSGATEFALDLVCVDPADGTLEIVAGVETTDQTAASAVIPAPTGDLVALFACLVDATDAEAETDQSTRGVGLDTTPSFSVVLGSGTIDGVAIAAATQVFTASSASNFAKDLVSVDAAGAITITAGTEAASAALAVVPDVPADEVALYFAIVGNAATGVTVSAAVRGKRADVSADETITL